MPSETVGQAAHLFTADHPARKDSAEYVKTRAELMKLQGRCLVCGNTETVEDHHGGGIFAGGKLVGLNLFGLEWSLGFSASPSIVASMVADLNTVLAKVGEPTWDQPITSTDGVMAWVDSLHNASVPLCKAHHVGRMDAPSKDVNGHEAVGIHEIPYPIWVGQITCDWPRWDMWLGTTGTAAGAPGPNGTVVVVHADPAHHPGLRVGAHVAADHHLAKAAHQGAS